MTISIEPTTTSSGTAVTVNGIKFAAPLPLPVGTHDLFDVVVLDPGEIKLVPRTELAKALCGMWLHMRPSIVLTTLHKEKNGYHTHLWNYDVEYITLRFDGGGSRLSQVYDGEKPWYRSRGITHEEHDIALKAIEAHRAARRAPENVKKTAKSAKPRRVRVRADQRGKGAK